MVLPEDPTMRIALPGAAVDAEASDRAARAAGQEVERAGTRPSAAFSSMMRRERRPCHEPGLRGAVDASRTEVIAGRAAGRVIV